MTPEERLTAAAIILRDAVEDLEYERALAAAQAQELGLGRCLIHSKQKAPVAAGADREERHHRCPSSPHRTL